MFMALHLLYNSDSPTTNAIMMKISKEDGEGWYKRRIKEQGEREQDFMSMLQGRTMHKNKMKKKFFDTDYGLLIFITHTIS